MLNPDIALCTMVIYMIRHKLTGKIYVGKTTRTLKQRIQEHIRYGRAQNCHSYIERSINRFGIEAFEISILEKCTNNDELDEHENFGLKNSTLNFQAAIMKLMAAKELVDV